MSNFLTTIIEGISIVTFVGDPGISAIAAELQAKSDHDGTPIATILNGVPLLAMPSGDAKLLVEGYYELVNNPVFDINNEVTSPEYIFYTPPVAVAGLNKLPNFIDWVRSLKLPGEFTTR